jgi:hypothetical protein
LFDVGFAGAGGDAPVDGFDGVTGFVAAGLDVFDALAEEGAAVCAVAEAVCEAFDREEELAAVEGFAGDGGWRFDRGDWVGWRMQFRRILGIGRSCRIF